VASFFYITDGEGGIAGILGIAGKGAVYAETCCCADPSPSPSASPSPIPSPSPSASPSPSPSASPSPSPGASPSASPSPSPSASASPSPSPCPVPWPGAGWYCITGYEGESCDALTLFTPAACAYIGTEAAWDAYQFGVCLGSGPYSMSVTDYVKHADLTACNAACGD